MLLENWCRTGTDPYRWVFYFAFGHSIIVFIAAFVAYWTASTAEKHFEFLKDIGGIVGTCVSVFFLFAIALINILILRGVYRAFKQVSTGGSYPAQTAAMLMGSGFLARLLGPLFKSLSQPWHMLPTGFLIIGLFIVSWVGSMIFYRVKSYDRLAWHARLCFLG
jgi:HoxN/HupN/NixA family high-affinity nickel-transporter